MPQINRIRVNNVKYNFGTQFYDDFLMRFNCKNTIYDLANGGGKSLLMLLLMQNMIPNCTLDEKQPIEKLFRKGSDNTCIHSLVEWKLDNNAVKDGFRYMTTGFCARKARDAKDEENVTDGTDILTQAQASSSDNTSVEYFNYCIFYRKFGENDIKNLPLAVNGERVTYNGLKAYLREAEKSDYNIKVYIFDRKGDYQSFISRYGIYESAWEIVRGINKTEGHVRTYFETNYRTSRKVVEDLLIEEIIQKSYNNRLSVDNDDSMMAKTLLDIKDKLIELSKKNSQINDYDNQIEALTYFKDYIATYKEFYSNKRDIENRLANMLLSVINAEGRKEAELSGHNEKEQELFKLGIKTLSLFFIDEVAKYRQYDEDGNELLGEYGKIFEQEYLSVLNEHRTLFDPAYTAYLDSTDVHDIHKGYFSIDKKGHSVNSSVKRGSDMSDDISAYDLILKNKERLLSFEEPTRFIFSHSALREGWDNPNVFQICTLKHSDSTTQKRQEVGRGLRLCVNKDGNRMDAEVLGDKVQDINVLTVIASESYAGFVDGLQKQTEAVLYDRPRKADIAYFTGKTIRLDGKTVKVDDHQARAIYQYLVRNNYVDEQDNVTQDYRDDVQTGTLAPVPETLKPIEEGVHTLVQAIYDDSMLKSMFEDGNKPKVLENPLNDRFEKAEFQKLWQTINHKYAYTVDFDSEELIQKAIEYIDRELYVSRLQYTVTYAGQKDVLSADMVREGSSFRDAKSRTKKLEHDYAGQVAYDLIGKIAENTTLTRRTVARILQGIKPTTFAMYQNNPEEFITKVIRLIKEQKATMIVEHITYDTIEGSYDSSIFTAEKHALTMDKAYKAQKAIQDYVFTDGTAEKSVERKFAENLDGAEEVFIYAKLPKGFYIPTPVGHYSPDWAIVFHEGKVKHIYFVAETKGTMESLNLRPIEKSKIDCAKKLFAKLSDGLVTYDHVDSYQELMNKVLQ